MRRSAVLLLLVLCAAAVVVLLLQMGGGDDRASSRRHEGRQGSDVGAPAEGDESGASTAGGATSGAGDAAAIDDDPNRVPGAELVLAGRVVKDGTGVEGASVVAVRAGPALGSRGTTRSYDTPPPPIATATSGSGGRFELRIARRTRVILGASKKGSGHASLFLLMPPEGNPPEVTLNLRPGGAVEGIVVNEKGDPVEGAEVAAGSQDWTRSAIDIAARTDAEGRFVLGDVPDGSFRIRAQAAGYPEVRHWLNVPAQKFVRLELRPAGIVAGTVTDGDGAPVAGARVTLTTSAWERGGLGGSAKGETDEKGRYRLEIYPGGMQSAVVEHPRYGRQAAGGDTFDLPTALVETGKELTYDIRLRKGVPVKGIAVYADTQEPAKGTNVALLRMSQQWRGMSDVDSATADESGRFEFPYVTEGTYGLEAKAEGGARIAIRYPQANQRVTIDFFVDGESAVPEQRLELLAMGGVRGRILGFGEPDPMQRPNVYLQYGQSWLSATVDDVGVFEMTHVPPMTDAILQSQNPQAKSEPFAVEAGRIAEVDLDASKQGVTGVVEDEKGNPVAGARVHLVPQNQLQHQIPQLTQNRGWGGALTDAQGRFSASAANWQGDYWANQKFVAVAIRQGFALAISDPLDLPKEGDPGPGLRLVLAQGGTVRGRVEHAGGAPAMNVAVSISPKTEQKQGQPTFETRSSQSVYTGFDGSFEITGVGDGVYSIHASHPEGKVESREVRAGDEGVKLVIEPAFAISGVVVTEGGSPVAYAQVSVIIPKERGEQPMRGQTQANGRFRIGQLAAGSYPVEVSPSPQQYYAARAGFETKRVEGIAAGTEDLVIVVSEGKGLRGKVEDQAGNPVAGAGVIAMPLEAKAQRPQGGQPYQSMEGNQSVPSATTNGRGEFEIKGVGDGEVEVMAVAEGYTPTSQRAVAGGAPVSIRLLGGEVIEGRLLKADGTPVARSWIWLQPMTKETQDKLQDWQRRGGQAWNYLGGWNMNSASTDPEGKFRFASLLPGEYRLQAQQQKDEVLPQVTLRTGMPPQTLRYERALTIRGRVTDAAGRPIVLQGGQRVYVNARLGKDQWLSGGVAGDNGAFEIRGIPTGSTVTLQVWAGNEYKPATVEAVAGADGVAIVLEKNEPQPAPPAK